MIRTANPAHIQRMDSAKTPEPSSFGAARASSVAPAALAWMAHTRTPRRLHIFDSACNLINERGEILAVVASEIGNGPFHIVIADPYPSLEIIGDMPADITIRREQLTLGGTAIDLRNAHIWLPKPDWQMLHENRASVIGQVLALHEWLQERAKPASLLGPLVRRLRDSGALSYNALASWVDPLCSAAANADGEACRTIARRVAGLGTGLTPAGDDLILGAIYAIWVIHPPELAGALARAVAEAALSRTTSLSYAWLCAGGRGEAGILWHRFLHALPSADTEVLRGHLEKLLAVGHTSGADALAGFVGTLSRCPPAV